MQLLDDQIYDDSILYVRPFFNEILDDIGIPMFTAARKQTLSYLYHIVGTCEGISVHDLNIMAGGFYDGFINSEKLNCGSSG